MLHLIVMAGGSGTRFWPQSRKTMPKQLMKLTGDRTMIQQTVDRCAELVPFDRTWIVTNQQQAQQTQQQLPDLPNANLLAEPAARNTAPCIGLAAIQALHSDPDATLFISPADHVITTTEQFQQAAHHAIRLTDDNPERLVLVGIQPTFPATGYGYIERGHALPGESTAFEVNSFREKPDSDTAQQYVDSGQFYWNCGIFCWKARTILNQLEQFEPDMYQRLMKLSEAIGTPQWDDQLATEFPQMNSISIDFAVLERADNVCVIEAPFSWDDVGSWLAVPRLIGADQTGNTTEGLVRMLDTKDCIIRTSDNHMIATLGIEDCIIVHTDDATLVARRGDSERIKDLLDVLREKGDDAFL
jgi:mannose-1-phosphate guanylyltransferase